MRRTALLTICLFTALGSQAVFAQKKVKSGPGPKSKGEAQAVTAVLQARTADERIAAVDDLVSKYADTDFKSFALELEAEAYQSKGDNTKAIVYAEQALQADPKNYDADNLLANIYAQTTRDTDLDKDDKLAKAEKYANQSLETLKTAEKSPLFNQTDEQWMKIKAVADSQAWQALGTIALVRKKDDEAVADFEKGVAENPDPILMIRTGRALLAAKKPDDAVTWFEKVMNSPDAPAQYKSIAQADRVRAIQSKGGSGAAQAKPAAPAAPAQH